MTKLKFPQIILAQIFLVLPSFGESSNRRAATACVSVCVCNDKLMSIELVVPSYHLILCHLLVPLPSIFLRIRIFSNESALHIQWPKYCSFSYSISPSNEYSGLISFRTHWLDLLAVQGTLKSLLQHHISKASILWLQISSRFH